MDQILRLLELDSSFFVQFVLFVIVFFVLSTLYFKPFLRLFQTRHERTVEDRRAAERMLEQANAKLVEYQHTLAEAKASARAEYERVISEARAEENKIIAQARDEAKKITQEAAASVQQQKEKLKKELEGETDELARKVSERLLVSKV